MKLIVLAALTALLSSCTYSEKANSLAQCLENKGAVLYGASWCGYCTKQKEVFGDAIRLIHYVDCDQEREKCSDQQIQALPTWIMGNGKRIEGYRSLEKLTEVTGCEW